MDLDDCEALFADIRSVVDQDLLVQIFGQLLKEYEILNCTLGPGSIFWRGRRSGSGGFNNLSDLSYPPAALCKTGRLNDQLEPVFYAAARETTVLSELHVSPGDYVHLIGYRISSDETLHLASFGEYLSIQRTGLSRLIQSDPCKSITKLLNSYENGKSLLLIFIDAFLAEILSDVSANQQGYRRTRALKNAVLRQMPDIDGLFYPSVRDNMGLNLALWSGSFDRTMEPVCSQVLRIQKARDYSVFDYDRCRHAIGIDENGNFLMQSPDSDASHIIFAKTPQELSNIEQGLCELGHKSDGIVRYYKLSSTAKLGS